MSYLYTNQESNVLTVPARLVATAGVSVLNSAATRPALSVVNTGASNSLEIRAGAFGNALIVGPPTGAGAGNVGIGTGTALQRLHVQGTMYASDAIGVGTTAPTAALHVVGDAQLAGAVTAGETFPDGTIASFPYANHLNDLSGCNVFGAPYVGAEVQYNPSGRVGTSLVAVNVAGGAAVNTVTYPVATAPPATATTGARPFAPPTADLPSPTGPAGFAVAAWIKPYGTASANRQFALGLEGGFGAAPVSGSSILAVGMEATTNYAVLLLQQSQGSYVTVTTGTALPLNAWTHVAATFSGSAASPASVVTLYVNGTATGTPQSYAHSAATPAFVNALTLFAPAAGAATGAFGGEVDSLSVYRRPLSAADVSALATGPASLAERAPAITANSLRLTGPLQLSATTTLSTVTTNSSNAATAIQLSATYYDMRDLSGTLAGIAADPATTGGSGALANFANGSVAPVSFGPFPATAPTEGAIFLDPTANATSTGSYLTTGVSAVASNAFAFNWWQSGGFTAEAHFNAKTLSATAPSPILSHASPSLATGIAYWSLQVAAPSRQLSFTYYNGAAVTVTGTSTLSSNTWYHVAATCDATNVRLFVNGALETTAALSGTPQTAFATTPITVGQTLGVNAFSGYLASVRLTRGSALYTSSFTAPTTPLSVAASGTTLLLLRAAAFSRTALQIGTQDGGRMVVSRISGPAPSSGSAGVGASVALQYPPTAATGIITNVLPSAATYGRGYYIISASSETAQPTTDAAWNAFGSANSWGTLNSAGYLYSTSSPFAYVGSTTTTDVSANAYAGEWLQIQLPSAIVATAFTLSGTSGQTTRAPASFAVLGSRDGASWVPVAQQSGVAFSAGTQLFAVTTAQAYTYFRLVVTNLTGNGATASLRGWILYGIPEALRVTSDGRIGVGVANPTAALEVAGDALFNGNVNVTGVLGDTLLTTAPYVMFDGTTATRDRFLAWMRYATSDRYRYKFSPVTLKKNVWWNTSSDATLTDPLTYSTLSVGAPGSDAYSGGVLLPDGRVVLVPHNAGAIGIFNPTTNMYSTTINIGTGIYKYWGGVLLPDGRVVFAPRGAAGLGIFNPTTNVFTTISTGAASGERHFGCVLLPDGRVVFVPTNATAIGIFNPTTNTYSTIGDVGAGTYKYAGGVLLPDGRVVFVPSNATTIGIFNPTTNAYSTIAGMPGGAAYSGGVLLPDGRVVFVPSNATTICIFNPTTNAYSTIAGMPGSAAYYGGVLLPDGRVAFVPASATTIGIFNPTTNAYSTIAGVASVTAAYIGGVLLSDGRILFVPYNTTTIGILSGSPRPPPELCYHPCFNKF